MSRRLLRSMLLVAAFVATLASIAPSAVAQGSPDLEASMLVEEDLPDRFFRRPEFDADVPPQVPDVFAVNGGIARRLHVWTRSSETGLASVFDNRTLFPSPEAARAYLLDAEDVLSERDSVGLVLDEDAEPFGDLHRLYTLEATDGGPPVLSSSHLFTVGPLVAKVFVSDVPGSGPAARDIAVAAAARMAEAVAAVTPPTPIPGPIASGGPDVSGIFQRVLLTRVGPGIETCSPITERAVAGELAAISCPIGDRGEVLVLRQLDTTERLVAAFQPFRIAAEAPAGDCRTGPAVEAHVIGGVAVGELACYDAPDGARVFIWTDERHDTLAWIAGTSERSFAALHDLYRSSLRDP